MENNCMDKLDKDENHKDIIYEARCPKCNYDIYKIYNKVYNGGKSKYCKLTNIRKGNSDGFYGTEWNVECICPKCKFSFTFSDGAY